MASCMICKNDVTTGFVLCPHCAESLKPTTLSPELAWFIDQLSEELVLNDEIRTCSMCAIGSCNSQVSGLTCRNAVKAWLLTKAGLIFARVPKAGAVA